MRAVIERLPHRFPLIVMLLFAAVLSGCASRGDKSDIGSGDPPEVIYAEADKLMDKSRFIDAAKKFEEVDRDHPYSPYARRAIAMSAFSYYKAGMYSEAIQAAKRYTTLHPGTKESALAQNIIAMSYYDRITDPSRDQGRTREALKELQTLVRRYPNSIYAVKARNRIKITTDMLAAAEMKVGRYYLTQKTYLAAINRYRTVITKYQTTAQVEEALMRVAEAYMALGIKAEAQTATAVLGHNFPESKWYQYAYKLLKTDGLEPRESKTSWISRAWRNVKPGSG
ncbi:MAG TPA: outer membrane protein assembly factor BamD [Rhizobiales bacterium]|nr:outer membrane protein assembly factor BamD precursor [bacterium BMS3Bbin10]HDO52836.1 outer membrane protein assembly factor BamD [Hyphomicrobiales bacterium]